MGAPRVLPHVSISLRGRSNLEVRWVPGTAHGVCVRSLF